MPSFLQRKYREKPITNGFGHAIGIVRVGVFKCITTDIQTGGQQEERQCNSTVHKAPVVGQRFFHKNAVIFDIA